MIAATLPESALAVFSTRAVHERPGLCISTGQILVRYMLAGEYNPYSPNVQTVEILQDSPDIVPGI
jgi:hypothetical protein